MLPPPFVIKILSYQEIGSLRKGEILSLSRFLLLAITVYIWQTECFIKTFGRSRLNKLINPKLYAFYSVQCTLYSVQYTLQTAKHTVFGIFCVQYRLYIIHCTIYSVNIQCTVYNVHYTVYTIQFIVFGVQYKVYSLQYIALSPALLYIDYE